MRIANGYTAFLLEGDFGKMKVREWLPLWLENYVKPTAKEKTYIRYSEVVKL